MTGNQGASGAELCNPNTLAATVTADDIRALRDEAGRAGDLPIVRVCNRALNGSQSARRACEQVILDARMRAAEDEDIDSGVPVPGDGEP